MGRECPVCQSTATRLLIDAKYVCAQCGHEDQGRTEMEAEEAFLDPSQFNMFTRSEMTKSVRQSKGRVTKQQKELLRDFYASSDDEEGDAAVDNAREKDGPAESYDAFIEWREDAVLFKEVGVRLTEFSRTLGAFMVFLCRERKVPKSAKKHAFSLWKRLLEVHSVAFCNDEKATDDKERFKVMIQSNRILTQEEREDRRKDLKAREAAKTTEALKTDVWAALASTKLTTDMLMEDEEGQAEEAAIATTAVVIGVAESVVSMNAVVKGGLLTLNLALLISIGYLSCLLAGCSWVTPADLVRWLRGGRFPLASSRLNCWRPVRVYDNGDMTLCKWNRSMDGHFNFYLHEVAAQTAAVMTLTGSPRPGVRLNIGLEELVARMAQHLNLPWDMVERALIVLDVTDVGNSSLDYVSADAMCAWAPGNRLIPEKGAPTRAQPLLGRYWNTPFVALSPDTRAAAVLLLTLRLTCGFRDYEMFPDEKVRLPHGTFDAARWMRQLRMRLRLWMGDNAEGVVRGSIEEKQRDYDPRWSVFMQKSHPGFRESHLVTYRREMASFPGGWEPAQPVAASTPFYGFLEPFPEDSKHERIGTTDRDMLFPLHWHADDAYNLLSRTHNESTESPEMKDALRLLREDFQDQTISEEVEEELPPDGYARRLHREGTTEKRWMKKFPSAINYEILPHPEFALTSLIKYDRTRGRAAGYVIGLGHPDASMAFRLAIPCMGIAVRFLLDALARIIGEEPSILHAATTLLEHRWLDLAKCQSIVSTLESGDMVEVEGRFRRERKFAHKPDYISPRRIFVKAMYNAKAISHVGVALDDNFGIFESDFVGEPKARKWGRKKRRVSRSSEESDGVEVDNNDNDEAEDEEARLAAVKDNRTALKYHLLRDNITEKFEEKYILPYDFVCHLAAMRLW